jgi:myosin heavy subunit
MPGLKREYIETPIEINKVIHNRDSLARILYEYLFSWLVSTLDNSIVI